MMRASTGRRILPLLCLVSALPCFASISRPVHNTLSSLIDHSIRVRISEGTSVVRVRGLDLRIASEAAVPENVLGTRPARKPAWISDRQSEWEFRCEDGRVRAQRAMGEGVGQSSLELAEPVVVQSPAGFIQYKGHPYRETLRIFSVGSLCEVVNEVDLEKYLEGLVNAEFNSRWNAESIGAQVVAARTYAIFQMKQARLDDQHYDIDATTYDQVYDGSLKEDARAARVVEKTRGWILTVPTARGPEPLKAYYHSNCGGVTELPEKVWGTPNRGFRRVSDPYCAHSPSAHWSFELSSAQIIAALGRAGRGDSPEVAHWPSDWKKLLSAGQLQSVRILNYDPSGRVDQVLLSFSFRGQLRQWTLSGAKFRLWVGPAQFKSTSFQVQLASMSGMGARSTTVWRFSGRGNGHGVGLCQWGAKAMGERGFKTAAILKFYYPDAQLRKIW